MWHEITKKQMKERFTIQWIKAGLMGLVAMVLWNGCSGNGQMDSRLMALDSLVSTHPVLVLNQLDSLSASVPLSRGDRMYMELLRGMAMNRADSLFVSDSVLLRVTDYYDHHGSRNNRMRAHFLLGCAYRDMGNAPRAIACYQEAVHCADTLSQDCDYLTLMTVHSQMAYLYNLQSLYDEATIESLLVEKYAWEQKDTFSALAVEEQLCASLSNRGQYDDCIRQAELLQDKWKGMGKDDEAALSCINQVRCYLTKGDYPKAKTYLDKYETCSYIHSDSKQIDGRLGPLYIEKGRYYLRVGIADSAEYYYRRAMPYMPLLHNAASVYRGLQETFSMKHEPDSIRKYTSLYSTATERRFNSVTAKASMRMKALYDYSVEQEIAKKKTEESERTRSIVYVLVLLLLTIVFFFVSHYRKLKETKKREIEQLSRDCTASILQYNQVQEELRLLETDHAAIKEKRLQELEMYRLQICDLQKRLSQIEVREGMQNPAEEEIVQTFKRKAQAVSVYGKPQMADWILLLQFVQQQMPYFYSNISKACSPNTQEHRTCILVRLGFTPGEIAILLDTTPQRITNVKAQLNHKFFGDNSASSFAENIRSANKRGAGDACLYSETDSKTSLENNK